MGKKLDHTGLPDFGILGVSINKKPLEKEKATHSSILAWRIPWTEEPGRLQSKASQIVGHNFATKKQQQIKPKVWKPTWDSSLFLSKGNL